VHDAYEPQRGASIPSLKKPRPSPSRVRLPSAYCVRAVQRLRSPDQTKGRSLPPWFVDVASTYGPRETALGSGCCCPCSGTPGFSQSFGFFGDAPVAGTAASTRAVATATTIRPVLME
jgi:hypothetical protein